VTFYQTSESNIKLTGRKIYRLTRVLCVSRDSRGDIVLLTEWKTTFDIRNCRLYSFRLLHFVFR